MIVTTGQTTLNVTVFVLIVPPVAVMVNVTVHVPVEVVAKVIVLPDIVTPVPVPTYDRIGQMVLSVAVYVGKT